MPEYSLNELAALADVTPRTIRFYIEQGLLPAPATLGPKSRYTDEQLRTMPAAERPADRYAGYVAKEYDLTITTKKPTAPPAADEP